MAFDPQKLKAAKNWSRPEVYFCVAHAADSNTLYAGASDGKVHVFAGDADKPEPTFLEGHESYVTCIAQAGENREMLVTGSYDRRLIWWDRQTGKAIRQINAHSKPIRQVAASPDRRLVASVADDMVCRVWDAASGQRRHEFVGHEAMTRDGFNSMLYACAFSPDGKFIATADRVGHINIWESDSGKISVSFESPEHYTWDPRARRHSIGGIRSLAFSPDGRQLAVGGMGHVGNIDHLQGAALVHLFDWQNGKREKVFESSNYKGLCESLEYIPNSNLLIGAGGDNSGWLLAMNVASGKFEHEDKVNFHVHDFYLLPAGDGLCLVGDRHITWYQANAK